MRSKCSKQQNELAEDTKTEEPQIDDTEPILKMHIRSPISNALSKEFVSSHNAGESVSYIMSNPVVIDDSIFVSMRLRKKNWWSTRKQDEETAINRLIKNSDGIYKYNNSTDQWTKVIPYSTNHNGLTSSSVAVAVPGTSQLLVWESLRFLYRFDVSTNKLVDTKRRERERNLSFYKMSLFTLFFLNHNLYALTTHKVNRGNDRYINHLYILNETQSHFQLVEAWKSRYDGSPSIYLSQTRKIIRFVYSGWRYKRTWGNKLHMTECLVKLSGKGRGRHLVSVRNEQFVLIMADIWDNGDTIFVYEVGSKQMYKSSVKIELNGYVKEQTNNREWGRDSARQFAVIDDDRDRVNIMVAAFIHDCWKSENFESMTAFPESLMVFIADFCKDLGEMLHIFNEKSHYCLSVAGILNNKTLHLEEDVEPLPMEEPMEECPVEEIDF